MREHPVVPADGTRIRAWRTEPDGPAVLLCPGTTGACSAPPARPADPARIALADHVDDALAVMDAAGIGRCVVMGWSVGVMVASELAVRHPRRVSGLLTRR